MTLVRLNKYLAEQGIASRRESDRLIAAGLVKVNGKVVTEMGVKVDPDKDKVEGRAGLHSGDRARQLCFHQ